MTPRPVVRQCTVHEAFESGSTTESRMDNLAETFAELKVADTLANAAESVGFSKPTALQQRVIPVILSGADVLLQARSGSGSSLAYLLPMMHRLLENEPGEGRGPRSLILSPGRDEAMKIGRTIKELGRDSPLRFGTVVGGRPYPMQHQLLRRPLDILVATPARLMDHIRRGRVPFERLEMLVIERADEMLAMGLAEDLYFIAESSPGPRQTLVFAQQIDAGIEALSDRLQRETQRIEFDEPRPPAVKEEKAKAHREGGRRRPRNARDGQARKSRGQKSPGNEAVREVNGNTLNGASDKPKQKPRNKPSGKAAKAAKAGGLRGPGRRGGQGRRQSDVRFPSDYANGPRAPQSPADAAEQHREVKRHEPMQYLADYGFSSGPRTRKPVTVVYRGKGRKSRRDEESGNSEED